MGLNIPFQTSLNARDINPSPITRTQVTTLRTTPTVSTRLNTNINPLQSKIDSNLYLSTLASLSRPMDRVQGLGSNSSSTLLNGVTGLTSVSPTQLALATTLNTKFDSASSLASSALRIGTISALAGNNVTVLSTAPSLMITGAAVTTSLLRNSGMSLTNSALAMGAIGLACCGILSLLLKTDINSLTSQLFQMQRSALAKLDSAANEVVQVIKKEVNKILSLLPECNLGLSNSKIEKIFKSVVAQISKMSSLLGGLAKNVTDCMKMMGAVLGMIGMFYSLFGGNITNINNPSSSEYSPSFNKLTKMGNLGNINNVNYYIGQTYPTLAYSNLTTQTTNNKTSALADIDYSTNQLTNSIHKNKTELNNAAASEILDTTLDDDINSETDDLITKIINIISAIDKLLDELEQKHTAGEITDSEYNKAKNALLKIKEELLSLIDDLNKMKDIPNENRDIISQNLNTMNKALDDVSDDITKTMADQKKDITNIFDTLISNASLIDQTEMSKEELDTSCPYQTK
jgi:hypothetical protein